MTSYGPSRAPEARATEGSGWDYRGCSDEGGLLMVNADLATDVRPEITLPFVYGLLPHVSKEVNDHRGDLNRRQSYIRPVVGAVWLLAIMDIRAPRAKSRLRPSRPRRVPAWLGAGPTGHAMIIPPRCASRRVGVLFMRFMPRRH